MGRSVARFVLLCVLPVSTVTPALARNAGAPIAVPDADSDAVAGELDNCPEVANGDQADQDGNGVGDACDPALESGRSGADDVPETSPNLGVGLLPSGVNVQIARFLNGALIVGSTISGVRVGAEIRSVYTTTNCGSDVYFVRLEEVVDEGLNPCVESSFGPNATLTCTSVHTVNEIAVAARQTGFYVQATCLLASDIGQFVTVTSGAR